MSSGSKQGGWTFGKSGDNPSLLTAFRADDALVEMIPQFDWPHKISLVSSSSSSSSSRAVLFGPFRPNERTYVPLWLALHLQTKCLCRIVPPHWLTTENLRTILHFEKTHAQLWPPPYSYSSPSDVGNDDENKAAAAEEEEEFQRQQRWLLPRNYYELATRLAPQCEDAGAVKLLVTDLLQVRLDKLRQQFQSLQSEQQSNNGNNSNTTGSAAGRLGLIVSIAGIGTAEVACLRETVQQALNDKEFLMQKKKTTNDGSSSKKSTTSSHGSSSSSSMPTIHDDAATATSSTTTTPGGGVVPGGRRPVRRFRGSIGRNNNYNNNNNSKSVITPGTT
jgi:GINS complex protein